MHLMSEYSHGEEHNHGKFEAICENNAIGVWTNLFATNIVGDLKQQFDI
jgi:hypothetical protein